MTIGRVYSIRSHTRPELVYYGSTKETLSRRMAGHRSDYKRFLAGKAHNMTSFRLIELGDAKIELVELVEFTEKSQLLAVEGRWIREHDCVNKFQPGRTHAQHYVDNREAINAQHAVYRAANLDATHARSRAYRAAHADHLKTKHNCDCGGKYITTCKARHARTAMHTAWLATTPQTPV